MGNKFGLVLIFIGLLIVAVSMWIPQIVPNQIGPEMAKGLGVVVELIGLFVSWRSRSIPRM